jgi:type I restriction enzyme S subunit
MLTDVDNLPGDWRLANIGSCAEILDSKRVPLSERQRTEQKGNFPYCGANGVIDYIGDYIFDGEYILVAEDGGNYEKFQDSAYLMSGKFWVNNHAHIIKAINSASTNRFLLYWLNYADLRKYVTGSTRTKLNQDRLRDIILPLPPIREQQSIAEILWVVDRKIESIDKEIQATEKLKTGLMQTLLTKGIGHTKFKMTEIGEIPEEWDVKPLHALSLNITDGKHGDCRNEKDSGYYFVSSKDVNEKKIVYESVRQITKEDFEEAHRRTKLEPEDVLLTNSGSIGKLAIAEDDALTSRTTFQKSVAIIKPDKKVIYPKYLYYVLLDKTSALGKAANGSAQKNLLLRDLREFKVQLTHIAEQMKIAEVLTASDKKIELLIKKKDETVSLKKALMQALLTGRVRVKHERTETYA